MPLLRHNEVMRQARIVTTILVGVVIGSACASSATQTTPPVRDDELTVVVAGSVIAPVGEKAMVCHTVLDSLPPQCGSGVEIIGLDISTLSETREEGGVMWTDHSVRLGGRLQTSTFTLTLTEPPLSLVREGRESLTGRELPCEAPSGGWPTDPVRNADVTALRGYGEQNANTWAGVWTASDHPVWVMAFTDDLPRHEAELAGIFDGPICFTETDYSRTELEAALAEIRSRSVEPAQHGPAVLISAIDEPNNNVWVVLWLADKVALAGLDGIDSDLLNVSGWLQIIDSDE